MIALFASLAFAASAGAAPGFTSSMQEDGCVRLDSDLSLCGTPSYLVLGTAALPDLRVLDDLEPEVGAIEARNELLKNPRPNQWPRYLALVAMIGLPHWGSPIEVEEVKSSIRLTWKDARGGAQQSLVLTLDEVRAQIQRDSLIVGRDDCADLAAGIRLCGADFGQWEYPGGGAHFVLGKSIAGPPETFGMTDVSSVSRSGSKFRYVYRRDLEGREHVRELTAEEIATAVELATADRALMEGKNRAAEAASLRGIARDHSKVEYAVDLALAQVRLGKTTLAAKTINDRASGTPVAVYAAALRHPELMRLLSAKTLGLLRPALRGTAAMPKDIRRSGEAHFMAFSKALNAIAVVESNEFESEYTSHEAVWLAVFDVTTGVRVYTGDNVSGHDRSAAKSAAVALQHSNRFLSDLGFVSVTGGLYDADKDQVTIPDVGGAVTWVCDSDSDDAEGVLCTATLKPAP